jgi:hypothetical protein
VSYKIGKRLCVRKGGRGGESVIRIKRAKHGKDNESEEEKNKQREGEGETARGECVGKNANAPVRKPLLQLFDLSLVAAYILNSLRSIPSRPKLSRRIHFWPVNVTNSISVLTT